MANGPVTGTVEVPASKSLTARYLVLAALADGTSKVHGPLVSRDSKLMLTALQQLGVHTTRHPGDTLWELTPGTRSGPTDGAIDIDCGLAGTVMRFLPPVAALSQGQVHFDGDDAARTRPIAPLLQTLAGLGVPITPVGADTLPFTVAGAGRVKGGTAAIDASASSQFVSALLLVAAGFEDGLDLEHTGTGLPSRPHIEMTIEVLRQAGVEATWTGAASWRVRPGPITPLDVRVEPDLSSAAPMLAAAVATGGSVTVRHWPQQTTQAGDALRGLLTRFGAETTWDEDGLTVTGPPAGQLRPVDLDLHDVGELTPVLAALAALATGTSKVRGVAHLRGHETDRLAALHQELTRVGAQVIEHPDGLEITGGPLTGGTWHSYADHRMAMAGAVIGSAVPDVYLDDVATTSKTYPGFAAAWSELIHGTATAPTGGR